MNELYICKAKFSLVLIYIQVCVITMGVLSLWCNVDVI